MMQANRINVTRSSMPPLEEYINEIQPLWESHWLTNMGEKHNELERSLESYLQVQDVRLFTNGHAALECVLEAMSLRGRVITTPFTFASTTHAIVRKGLEPVFADVRPADLTIDPESVESLIDSSTCAILAVHVYGNPCDNARLLDIARRNNLKLIYDAAHAFGVMVDDEPVCSWGDASMLSFHATKVFNTVEGGAICLSDSSLVTALERWRNFGIESPDDVEYAGGNAKLDELRAAMGICNLRHVDEEILRRKEVYDRYIDNLQDISGLRIPEPAQNTKRNYSYMPVVFEDSFGVSRDEIAAALASSGVFARKYFYPLTSSYACYRGMFDSADTPIALDAASKILTLPMYAGLERSEVDRICTVIRHFSR